jgi:hypothetical protein
VNYSQAWTLSFSAAKIHEARVVHDADAFDDALFGKTAGLQVRAQHVKLDRIERGL